MSTRIRGLVQLNAEKLDATVRHYLKKASLSHLNDDNSRVR